MCPHKTVRLQAEINALQKLIESSGEEDDDDDDDDEEEEEEEEEETDSKASGEGKERAGAEKAERKRMKEVLKASGMPKAEMAGMLKLYARSKQVPRPRPPPTASLLRLETHRSTYLVQGMRCRRHMCLWH